MEIDYRIFKPKYKFENNVESFSIPCYVKEYGSKSFYFNRSQEIVKTRNAEIERLNFKTGKLISDTITIYEKTIESFESASLYPPYETEFILKLNRQKEIEKIIYTKSNVGLVQKLRDDGLPEPDPIILEFVFNFNYQQLNQWLFDAGFENYE